MWLPRTAEGKAVAEHAPVAAECNGARSTALHILLVDDNEAVRATTEALLVDLGHSVESAEDGPSMLHRLRNGAAYDLIITDYAMPLMSGGEAMLQARELHPDIPAIIISGYADVEEIDRKPAGVQILGKPFSLEEMARAIETATEAVPG